MVETPSHGFDAKSLEAKAWAEKFAADRVKKVSAETRKALKEIIVDSIKQKIPPRDSALLIRGVVGMSAPQAMAAAKYFNGLTDTMMTPSVLAAGGTGLSKANSARAKAFDRYRKKLIRRRSITIARTEVIDSLSAGMEQSWVQAKDKNLLGKNAKKKWLATSFGACPICRALAMEEPVPLDGSFNATLAPNSLKPIKRPTAHPNCRCALIPVPGAGGLMFPTAAPTQATALSESAWMDALLTKKVGGAKGSNLGGVFEDAKGSKYYVKEYKNPQQAMSEAAANSVYRELGLEVPDSIVRVGSDGKTYFISKWMDDLEGTLGNLGMTAADANKILDGFVADVFTMNWDAVGTGLDNVVRLAGGKIARIDQGGAFLFRAQGALKPASLLGKIDEWESFVSHNAYYRKVFEKAGIKSADDLAARAISQIDDLKDVFKQYGSWDDFLKAKNPNLDAATRKQIASMMQSRFTKLVSKAKQLISAAEASAAAATLSAAAKVEASVTDAVAVKKGVQKVLDKAKTYAEIWKRIVAGEKAKGIAADLNLNINNVYRIIRKLKKGTDSPSIATLTEARDTAFKFWDSNLTRRPSFNLEEELADRYQSHLKSVSEWADGYKDAKSRSMGLAIKSYTGSGYESMNENLRRVTRFAKADPKWTPKTRAFQKFLVSGPPPPDDLVVWRGTHSIGRITEKRGRPNWDDESLVKEAGVREGDVLRLDGFQSTAIRPDKAWRQGGRTMLEIHPSCGAYVDRISANSGEKEFVLPHGQKFRVAGIKTLKMVVGREHDDNGKLVDMVQKIKVIQLVAVGGCPK